MLPPWRLNVKYETPFVFNFRCRVHLPAWPAMLPVCLTRKWLKEHLRREGERLTSGWRDAVIVYAADNVRKGLDHLASEVEMRANEIGLRMMASLRSDKSFAVDSETNAETLDTIRRQLLALRAEICPTSLPATNEPDESIESSNGTVASVTSMNARVIESVAADLTADLKTRSCPVCDHLTKVAFHFLTNFQCDLMRDEAAQQDFAETLGICPLHTWQLESVSSPVGASVGFAKLTEHVSKILAARAKSPSNGRTPIKLIRDSTECHVCRILRETEQDYLRRLAEFIEQPNGRAAYVGSQGVCLRHLGLWLPFLAGDETVRFVLEEASRHFEQMAEDMQHFSLKTEALRRELRNQDEEDAYLRAIIHLAGTKSNCQPMNKEAEI